MLPTPRVLGENMEAPRPRRAVEWLLGRQNPDGGWADSCASYAVREARGQNGSACRALASSRRRHSKVISNLNGFLARPIEDPDELAEAAERRLGAIDRVIGIRQVAPDQ